MVGINKVHYLPTFLSTHLLIYFSAHPLGLSHDDYAFTLLTLPSSSLWFDDTIFERHPSSYILITEIKPKAIFRNLEKYFQKLSLAGREQVKCSVVP